MNLDGWQASVVRAMDALDGSAPMRNGEWTSMVLGALCSAGKEHGFYTCASGQPPPADWGEWLWDSTWLDYRPDMGARYARLLHVPMVAECEWGPPWEIWDDFDKLLASSAPLRVMVFDGRMGEGASPEDKSWNVASTLHNRLKAAPHPGREVRYLLAAWEKTSARSMFRFFQILSPVATERSWSLHEDYSDIGLGV